MYGLVAHQQTHSRSRSPRPRTQDTRDKITANDKKLNLKERIQRYLQKRFNPEPEQDIDEFVYAASRNHRPEELCKLQANTNFTKKEIKLIYRGFKQECPTGLVDEDAFKRIFSQFFPLGDATGYAHYVFNTIQNKQGAKVNFEEFLQILSRVSRGTVQEKLSWIFALYDIDGDGQISKAEMLSVVTAIYDMLGRATTPTVCDVSAKEHVDRIFNLIDKNRDGVVSPEELAEWCLRDPRIINSFYTLDTVL